MNCRSFRYRRIVAGLAVLLAAAALCLGRDCSAIARDSAADEPSDGRRPSARAELRYWLENMVRYHRFSLSEVAAATGMPEAEIERALDEFHIKPGDGPPRPIGTALLVLPYPGGRHPRIGFLDGAVRPQRETKLSVFTPWDPASYVVADVPEAVWSNLGLTYLAHTHVPTVWTKQNVALEKLEWNRRVDGSFDVERRLPNGIRFRTRAIATPAAVRMEMSLHNGTDEPLRDLRVQMCVMLKGAAGFQRQSNENKVLSAPYAAARSDSGDRWIITAWKPSHRVWANPPCPCLHSDPKFPDCAPDETVHVRGWLSFYEGMDIDSEMKRIDGLGWDE